jgi:hypothetical protein
LSPITVGRDEAAVGAGFTAGAADAGNVSSNSMPSAKLLGTDSFDIATAKVCSPNKS